MKRDIFDKLESWKTSPRRKPLILNGARQVGKTFALKYFGKTSYAKVAYLNFERDESLRSFFVRQLGPKELIPLLSIHLGIDIQAADTLLIFDEVQNCPEALNSLKYFCEEMPEQHVVAAGSLLGVLTAGGKGFPVGKVNFLHVYPMTFFEFIEALGEKPLRDYLEQLTTLTPLPDAFHEKLMSYLRLYIYIGGMPEAVLQYVNSKNLNLVREVQLEILSSYERDFAKHVPLHEQMKIQTVWGQIHSQLAKEVKKFVFASIRKSARGRDYELALEWLINAGLIHKSCCLELPHRPLSTSADPQAFKVFLFDVGLLGAQSKLAQRTILEPDALFVEFKGALTENFVAQELVASGRDKLFYWTSGNTAEVDFIVEDEDGVYPLEVKASISTKKKSLLVYQERYKPSKLYRAGGLNLLQNGAISNYPLYLVCRLGKIG